MSTLKAHNNNFLLPSDISKIVIGVSFLTQGVKNWIGTTLNTVAINILSILFFPVILICWGLVFYLKKKVDFVYKLNFNHINSNDYKVIIKSIQDIGPHYKTFTNLANLNYKPVLPFLVWGLAQHAQDILKAFCFYVDSYIKFSYKLDFQVPKDDLFNHITSPELLTRRNKHYDYLI